MTAHARARHEGGLSLIELLVTVAILGIAFVSILGGMSTSIIASDIHRKQAIGQTVLRSYADALKRAAYEDCATSSSYATVVITPPAGFDTPVITDVDHWTPDSNPVAFQDACPSTDAGIQRITLSVQSSDSRAVETVQILKRRTS